MTRLLNNYILAQLGVPGNRVSEMSPQAKRKKKKEQSTLFGTYEVVITVLY